LIRFGQLTEEEIQALISRHAGSVETAILPLIIRLSGYNIKRTFEFLEQDVLSVRDQAVELLRKIVLIHRAQELMQIIEPVAAQKDRESARLLLWFLLLWFQDILHLQKMGGEEQRLFNRDKKDVLIKFLSFTPDADIAGIVWDIESAVQDLDDPRNYNPLLILTTLAIKLNKKIRKI
jgi:hypothetical protein